MPKPRNTNRPQKRDTFVAPDASAHDTQIHYCVGPYDAACRAMSEKWGIDRLPELVSPELAEVWGVTVANLNAAIKARHEGDSEQARANVVACVNSALRGFKAMDAQAEASGAKKADTGLIEADVDGYRFAILRDGQAWQAVKALRPDLRPVSLREVAVALKFYETHGRALELAQEAFPNVSLRAYEPTQPFDGKSSDPISF